MRVFALGIEHPLDMTVERLHDPHARHHRWPVLLNHQQQCLDSGLPFVEPLVGLRKLGDVGPRIFEGEQLLRSSGESTYLSSTKRKSAFAVDLNQWSLFGLQLTIAL
jgi:hypothetical protein